MLAGLLLAGSANAVHGNGQETYGRGGLDARHAVEDEIALLDDEDVAGEDVPMDPEAGDPAAGDTGDSGEPADETEAPDDEGPMTSVLPSGVTLRGAYVVKGYKPLGEPRSASSAISFGFELGALEAQWIPSPDKATRECFGSSRRPQAAPGFLCLYQRRARGVSRAAIETVDGRANAASSFGAVIDARGDASFEGRFYSVGSWAATPR
jgi:hypothetical protein